MKGNFQLYNIKNARTHDNFNDASVYHNKTHKRHQSGNEKQKERNRRRILPHPWSLLFPLPFFGSSDPPLKTLFKPCWFREQSSNTSSSTNHICLHLLIYLICTVSFLVQCNTTFLSQIPDIFGSISRSLVFRVASPENEDHSLRVGGTLVDNIDYCIHNSRVFLQTFATVTESSGFVVVVLSLE
ncbi:unnamed protein product [Vicia faba]|uniref:Uncharacterized protein n=1 Tax=Vicia faba TaxID=3906 RepID=A0AAV1AIL8_VICFA|nr:unnamed protein product [Vicia faba]